MNYSDKVFLTFDMDWACDEAVMLCAEILRERGATATFFVTHGSPALVRLRSLGFDLGIHPNFEKKNLENEAYDTILHLKEIVPEAACVRSHTLLRSSRLPQVMSKLGLTHESDYFIPHWSGIELKPFENPRGIIQVPYNWGDYSQLMIGPNLCPDRYLLARGLKVMTFHPVHVFINTCTVHHYSRARPFTGDCGRLSTFVNNRTQGIRDCLIETLKRGRQLGIEFGRLSEICPTMDLRGTLTYGCEEGSFGSL